MNVKIEQSWKEQLAEEFAKPYFEQLAEAVRREYRTTTCYPPAALIFNAFNLCPFDQVRVVGVALPPSLQNIFKEIAQDTGATMPTSGNLERWARQGVLLLNATLTVRAHEANSHAALGWQRFTDAAIQAIATKREHVVYMLWGGNARRKAQMIDRQRNLVLESVHPSPLSANRGGWFGEHQFSRCNAYLRELGMKEIEW